MPVDLAVPRGTSKLTSLGSISVRELKEANVAPGTSALDVEARISAWRRERAAQRAARRSRQPVDEASPDS